MSFYWLCVDALWCSVVNPRRYSRCSATWVACSASMSVSQSWPSSSSSSCSVPWRGSASSDCSADPPCRHRPWNRLATLRPRTTGGGRTRRLSTGSSRNLRLTTVLPATTSSSCSEPPRISRASTARPLLHPITTRVTTWCANKNSPPRKSSVFQQW